MNGEYTSSKTLKY